jgi:hypothetical protein
MITVIARTPIAYRGQDVLIGQPFQMRAIDALVARYRGEIAWTTEKSIFAGTLPWEKSTDQPAPPEAPLEAPRQAPRGDAKPMAEEMEDDEAKDEEGGPHREPDDTPAASASTVETRRRGGRSRYRRSEADVERTTDLSAEQ